MMIPLTTEVKTQIAAFKQLQSSATQVESIQATAAALEPVRSILARWISIFPALESVFDPAQCSDLHERAATLHRRLHESKDKFATDFNQHEALTRIQSEARALEKATAQYWSQYAVARFQAQRELARFARLLPHMQGAMQDINTAVADLQDMAERLPVHPTEIQSFHAKLAHLDTLLRDLRGMDEQQTSFLNRLSRGTATLADVSPDLLEWCQQEELAALLKISL